MSEHSDIVCEDILKYMYDEGPMDKFYEKQLSLHWGSGEIMLSDEKRSYESLEPSVKIIVKYVLAFFLLGDRVIIDNITNRMINILSTDDSERYFILQAAQELVHVDTYKKIVKAVFSTPSEFNGLLKDIINSKSVNLKIQYGHKWTKRNDVSDIERVFSFIANEGIFFVTQFKVISEIRRVSGGMRGLDDANTFIRRDEFLHRDAGIFIAELLFEKISKETNTDVELVRKMYKTQFINVITDAVNVEIESIDDIFDKALSCGKLTYININDIKNVAKSSANLIASALNYSPLYPNVIIDDDYSEVENSVSGKSNIWECTEVYTTPASNDINYHKGWVNSLLNLEF